MNRKWTNRIRFVLDEIVPTAIRDSRWFMYPFYYLAYRGRNISEKMDFKRKYFEWSPLELQQFYENIRSISTDRPTDISPKCIQSVLQHCGGDIRSVLDVGCGKGYLLQLIKDKNPTLRLHGVDFARGFSNPAIAFTKADAVQLPFADKSFDLVICAHTIEHVYEARELVKELKRVAAKKIIVITPRQRYFYYTLDEHINFFPQKEYLTSLMDLKNYTCENIEGDWFYVANL
jgi:ubiquinone/menaquinone biosynthesis C-methylase UbiE